jgi:hypothetical protein
MTTRPPRWRIRRRPLLYGTAAMLSGMTIALAAFSVVGYVRYQQQAAAARAADAKALEAETFGLYMGMLTPDGGLFLGCDSLGCGIALRPGMVANTSDTASSETTAHRQNMLEAAARAKHLRIVSKSGGDGQKETNPSSCEISVDLFRPSHADQAPGFVATIPMPTAENARRQTSPVAITPDCLGDQADPKDLTGVPGPDGQTRATAVIIAAVIIWGRVDHFDFLDEASQVIISIQVSQDAYGNFRPTALDAADGAAQAATNSRQYLIAVSGGTLLTFIALSAFGWVAVRKRLGPRSALRRQGQTGSRTRQPSYCDETWADRVAMGLIASAVSALDHPDDQDRYHEEWFADSDEISGRWRRLRWALLTRLCAPMGIRSARRDALSMSPPQQQ